MRDSIGHYRIGDKLGEGGMGVVFRAHDEALDRPVALKMLREAAGGRARERLLREARAGASVNHPNVCQVYEVAEQDGELYIAMELLEGEAVSTRLQRGPLPAREALRVTHSILTALEALHARDIVHRDLKPSNVFLTPHGVKLMDFGLALALGPQVDSTELRLTQPGTAIGTPSFMSPEQWAGEPVGPASDIFQVGALLFEMLTGRPAFSGSTVAAVYHAVVYEQPPALSGGPEVMALDRIIQRALAKKPHERFANAAAMAREVDATLEQGDSSQAVPVRALKRLIVLPFRMLRPDPEIDFLAFGLADAIGTSLSGLESLVVRSSAAAARFAGDAPDLPAIASQVEVDLVLLGTLLRAGDQVRVAAQLVEVPSGTLTWAKTAQLQLRDIFQFQDEVVHQIVGSLRLPLSSREHLRLRGDVPANAPAYESYLRANNLGVNVTSTSVLVAARDLYQSSLREDPTFAPSWARLGRVYRVMAKYGHGDPVEYRRLAGEAFQKALELNPDLALAHHYYTYYEIEELGRPREAMVRLLERARANPSDPQLYSGLVVACRFCGLLEASVAAHQRARRLDPGIESSVVFTHWMRGDYPQTIAAAATPGGTMTLMARAKMGYEAEAIEALKLSPERASGGFQRAYVECLLAALQGDRDACVAGFESMPVGTFRDPEGLASVATLLARAGLNDRALSLLESAVEHGLHCTPWWRHESWLDGLRGDPRFLALMERAEAERRSSKEAYLRAGGGPLLGSVEAG